MSSLMDKVTEIAPFSSILLKRLTKSTKQHAANLLRFNNLRTAWEYLLRINLDDLTKFTLGFFFIDVPLQVPLSGSALMALIVDVILSVLKFNSMENLVRFLVAASNRCPMLICDNTLKLFSYKAVADSQNKLNMYFSEVILATKKYYPIAYRFIEKYRALFFFQEVTLNRRGKIQVCDSSILFNDQASAIVLYYCALAGDSENLGLLLHAALSVYLPQYAKALSIIVKNSGSNGDLFGARLCEAQTLTGRGVGSCDLHEEAAYRCNAELCDKSVWHFDEDKLRSCIHQVLSTELEGATVEFPTLEDFWQHRWQWCVNGSHSAVLGNIDKRFKVSIPGITQLHRRTVIEQLAEEPISGWNGEAYFTGSLKLEHGKLRALFACDTLTYFAFEHLLRPVEKAWHGFRVLLDPGAGGLTNVVRRIHLLRKRGACNIMIDFEDFNSQHSIRAQQILFEELIKLVNYDSELGSRILYSFDHMNCYVSGKRVGHMYGTLCSGHRATTFINSVLNAAYIDYVIGDLSAVGSMHVGDDVYIACPDLSAAAEIISAVRASGLRVNPMKQSIGYHTAEFLRLAVTERHATGYVARSISSAISGNWLTLHKQNAVEFLRTMVAHAWTLGNRCGDPRYGLLLVMSVGRVTRVARRKLEALLTGKVALGSGPARTSCDNYVSTYEIVEDNNRELYSGAAVDHILSTVPKLASQDYLSHCVSELEREALKLTRVGVIQSMVKASYAKTLSSKFDTDDHKVFRLDFKRHFLMPGCTLSKYIADRLNYDTSRVGVLNRYPLLTQLKNQFNMQNVLYFLSAAGASVRRGDDIDVIAWGLKPHPVVIDGFMPYADAVAYSSTSRHNFIRCDYPIYM